MGLGRRIASGAFWSLFGALVTKGLSLIGVVIIARLIGKAGFGHYSLVQSTVGVFQMVAALGLGMAATKLVADARLESSGMVRSIVSTVQVIAGSTGTIVAICVFILSDFISLHVFGSPEGAGLLRVACPSILLGAIVGAQSGAIYGYEAFRQSAVVNLIVGLISTPTIVVLTFYFGILGAVSSLSIALLVNLLLNAALLQRLQSVDGQRERGQLSKQVIRKVLGFSTPTLLSSLAVVVSTWACSAFLVRSPDGFSEMGIFNAANQWRMVVLFIPTSIGNIALPLFSSLQATGQMSTFKKTLILNTAINGGIATAVSIVVIAIAPSLMGVYGPDYSEGVLTLRILVLSSVFSAILNIVGQSIASKGEMWWAFLLNSLWAITLLVSCVSLVHLGAKGLAIAYLISYLVHLTTVSIYTYFQFFKKGKYITNDVG